MILDRASGFFCLVHRPKVDGDVEAAELLHKHVVEDLDPVLERDEVVAEAHAAQRPAVHTEISSPADVTSNRVSCLAVLQTTEKFYLFGLRQRTTIGKCCHTSV